MVDRGGKMPGLEIIDAHTHVHASAEGGCGLGGRGLLKWFNEHAGTSMFSLETEGSTAECLSIMDACGITKTMIVPWMPAKKLLSQRTAAVGGKVDPEAIRAQIASEWSCLNHWALEATQQHAGRFDAVVGTDPITLGAEWSRKQFAECLAGGAVGLKITPPFMEAPPDDPRLAIVWEEAERRRLPVLVLQSGHDPNAMGHVRHLEPILKAYPHCKVVAAHLGMGGEDDFARLAGKYPNLYGDTSYWLGSVSRSGEWTPERAVSLFRRAGMDRVMFGTNYPMKDPKALVEILLALPLTDSERRQVCSENFRHVYGDGRGSAAARSPSS